MTEDIQTVKLNDKQKEGPCAGVTRAEFDPNRPGRFLMACPVCGGGPVDMFIEDDCELGKHVGRLELFGVRGVIRVDLYDDKDAVEPSAFAYSKMPHVCASGCTLSEAIGDYSDELAITYELAKKINPSETGPKTLEDIQAMKDFFGDPE